MPDNLSGMLTEHGHSLPVRVYYEDTDFSGVVYHARYLHFFERGRSDFLRLKGVHHHEMRGGALGEPLFFVVRHMDIDFVSAAGIDDVLLIETVISNLKGVRIMMDQTITRDGDVIAQAKVTVVLIDGNKRPKRLPASLVEALTGSVPAEM